ncbi:Chitinase 2 [Coemansia sp. RSA 2399]|nr:Chitinase 2 [Coemansia sp. RSA 2399]KAJ1907914.1 Chitinase 2 [Coemansia sp. IMI 209127]
MTGYGFLAKLASLVVVASASALQASGFNITTDTDGLAVYWGQNTLSIQTNGAANEQQLSDYCSNTNAPDIILLAFNDVFTVSPQLDLANHCQTTFQGSAMLDCQSMADQITACQKQGIQIILSMGGASGAYSMATNSTGEDYAQTVYDTYLGGNNASVQRPFGDAVLDGIDLDIEGGEATGYAAFTNKLHQISPNTVITGAPQCPFPDAYLGDALDNGWFDAVFVQFYNNVCSPDNSGSFNFDTWANWASTKSQNKNVKVYIGSPACQKCAGSGFLGATELSQVYTSTKAANSDVLGGIMLWDIGSAYYGSNTIAASLLTGPLKSTATKAKRGHLKHPNFPGDNPIDG